MTLEERFAASNKNTSRTKYNGVSKQTTDHSRLNVDAIPTKYNLQTKLDKDGSRLNIDVTPKKYHG